MQLEKPKLFLDEKSFIVAMLFLLCLLLFRLGFTYHSYKDFISKPFYYTYAQVIYAYQKSKSNRDYQVLKLRSEEGLDFYTTNRSKEDFTHKRLRMQIFPNDNITFWEYLGTFYVKSKIKEEESLPSTLKEVLLKKVASQHEDPSLESFYNAIFFATPLDKELREKISMLGISHLVALSGFHLGILWGLVYGTLLLLYRPFQQRFFPYRHSLFDVGMVAMVFLGLYVWFVDFPPSLVRSYAMVMAGWVMLILGMELLSFTFLTTIALLLLVLFPSLTASLSFWLSVAGVFYIFLVLQYSKGVKGWIITLLYIPFGIFIFMLPVVHSIFPVTNVYQLLSPILSLLFIPFYPLVMALHLFGFGGMFDSGLLYLFGLPQESAESLLPVWALVMYVGISIGAIWSKRFFWLMLSVALIYTIYIFSL